MREIRVHIVGARHDEVAVSLRRVIRRRDSKSCPEEDTERRDSRGDLIRVGNPPHNAGCINKRSQRRDDDKRNSLENIVGPIVHDFPSSQLRRESSVASRHVRKYV